MDRILFEIESSDLELMAALKAAAPSGILIEPVCITPLSVDAGSHTVFIAIRYAGKFIGDISKSVLTAFIVQALKKCGYLGADGQKPKKITIRRREIECTEGNITRIVEECYTEEP